MIQECPECGSRPLGTHVCAFLTGGFDANNWNCGVWARLERSATRWTGDEVEVLVNQTSNGTAVVWVRRVGQAQRVRKAVAIAPDFTQVPVTVELLDSVPVFNVE